MVDPEAAVASEGLRRETVMLPLMVVALPAGIGRLPVEARVVPLAGEGIVVVEVTSALLSVGVSVAATDEAEEVSSD